jgi:hypothetical protein
MVIASKIRSSIEENNILYDELNGEEFQKNGFTVIRNCLSSELLEESHFVMSETLSKLLKKEVDYKTGIIEAAEIYRQHDVQTLIHDGLQSSGVKKKILLQPKLLNLLIHFIGPDLEFNRDGSIFFNLSSATESIYMKKWHQELWSGGGIMQLNLWVPLHMPESSGGMAIINKSHIWGLVPNQNREPTQLPDSYNVVDLDVKVGDVVIFHPLALHKTSPNESSLPRVVMAYTVRNIYHASPGLAHHSSWQPFHLSPKAKIERALGNPYLTPYRTLGGSLELKMDNKRELPGILE